MSQTIEAVYENGLFRPLEIVTLSEGERVQVTLPGVHPEIRRRLSALDAFEEEFEDLTKEQWELFDEAVQRRPWFGDRELEQ
ncbi:antitoxin family protein [Candidatus Poribacteria bacterium]|nr:antitoxin family protein [Candidatus Poribacteria bacterium]